VTIRKIVCQSYSCYF